MKNTIIISAATCLITHFLIWVLGWVVWPLAWAISGILFFRLGNRFANDEESNSDRMGLAMAGLMGPTLVIVVLCIFWEDITDRATWLPSIRNPFVWPEKHD